MKNRLYDYICIFVLLEIIPPPICYAKVINDAYRTKRNISVFEIPQSKENVNYAKDLQEVSSKIKKKDNNNFEKGDKYFKEKHKISKRSTNSDENTDFQQSNPEKPINYDNVIAINHLNAQRSNDDESDYAGEADEEMAKQERDKDDKDEETSSLVRLARDVNAGLDKYTDQEQSSLYDDYEAKDVAKRGVLGSPEDYEEAEVDSPGIEDVAAMQEQRSMTDEADKREVQNDARVKRDQAIAEAPDQSKSISDNPVRSVQSKIAPEDSYLHQVSPVESLNSFNEASAPNDASKIKEFGSNEAISKAGDASKIAEPASIITSSKEDEANAKYEKRVEEEIQRKINAIKEEIKRDIEAQGRVRGIEENNARFDELQNQEGEDEEGSSFENEPLEKRQTAAKRSVREIADIAAASSKRNGKKRSLKKQQRKKPQRTRAKKIGKSDISKKNKNLKRRSVVNHDESSGQTPSKGLSKKKREHVRQTFLVSNEQAKRRRSTSYALPSGPTDARSENELLTDQDSNSRLHTDNKMLQAPLSVASEDENNEGERSPIAAAHSNSLASLTGSSQELNPRLAKEYKEAFGGLQSEPGSALARFKRIKRVLESPETEKM
ncbi:caldesmon-like [Linepithema humile]|uniref:caldesmon-like n=1 Tax=Linepithema humile TaxID=83485 RepID=UPI0006232E4B|nr:PREDICTED: acidic repeat-containing protein-like [Linepithema humile]